MREVPTGREEERARPDGHMLATTCSQPKGGRGGEPNCRKTQRGGAHTGRGAAKAWFDQKIQIKPTRLAHIALYPLLGVICEAYLALHLLLVRPDGCTSHRHE